MFMKKSKALLLGAGILSASFLMVACSSTQSNASDKTYSYVFASNPDTLDYITSLLRHVARLLALRQT